VNEAVPDVPNVDGSIQIPIPLSFTVFTLKPLMEELICAFFSPVLFIDTIRTFAATAELTCAVFIHQEK
jgi:hypothetical protein